MGFYSFYRIFKDIIRSIFGNKAWRITLIICLIALVFIFITNNTVNASDLRPWNVYNNTTEFNWSRLTNLNFVGGSASLPYKMYEIKPDEIYYLYNPNSNSGTIHYYCYTSNDVNRPMMLVEDTSFQAALHLDYNFEIPSGYVDLPYNSLFTPQMTYYVFITDSCELYLFDDKYSNIEAYNELSSIADYLYGSPTDISGEFSVVNNLTIGDPTTNGSFSTTTSASKIYYMPLENGRITNLDLTVTLNPTYSYVVVGYCDSIPSNNVPYIHYSHYTGSGTFNISGSFSSHKYLFVRTIGGTVTINSSSVNNIGLEGMNNNASYQGEATRETLTDSNISQNSSDYTLPTDSTNDITQDGFANIFERIRNTFTSGASTPATIPVPFTNKSFVISYETVFGSANLGIIKTIIQSFWWFVVSLFIVKDIFEKIEKLKTGDIEFTETTNIKEDIL